MKKKVLSREQMQHLIDLGFDVSNASCVWCPHYSQELDYSEIDSWRIMMRNDDIPINAYSENYPQSFKDVVYAYTLEDIIHELKMIDDSSIEIEYPNRVALKIFNNEHNGDVVSYGSCISHIDNLIDAAYEVLCYAKEHKFL